MAFFDCCWLNLLEKKVMPTLNIIIIYMEKLLDSDWLGAVQFKCHTSANYLS